MLGASAVSALPVGTPPLGVRWPGPPVFITVARPDPYYDLAAQLPAGYLMTREALDALASAYLANGYKPITQAQAIAAVSAVEGAQPAIPAGIPRMVGFDVPPLGGNFSQTNDIVGAA